MQSVFFLHRWWVLRAAGRNPLVRGSDRLELLIVAVGLFLVVVAGACAGALGTAVHDARSRVYVAQAQTRSTVVAEAIDDSRIVVGGDHNATRVNAKWHVDGTERTGSITLDHAIKTGDTLRIWVDRGGNRVEAPTPTSQAGVEAAVAGYAAWLTVAVAVAGFVRWGRSRLDRWRDSAWERDLRYLIHDNGGRTA